MSCFLHHSSSQINITLSNKVTGAFTIPKNMFPWGNSDNPLEPFIKKPSFDQIYDHQNPIISKQDDDESPFFSNFPSPFFDEHDLLPLSQILLKPGNHYVATDDQNNSDSTKKESSTNGASNLKEKVDDRRRKLGLVPRKRTGKKDRHSKIRTAQGIRDRRMRLSLQVARKFFDLQDMLGYDKASKTIEWLFNKSKKAIMELVDENLGGNNSDAKSESFISECEVVYGIEENSNSASPLCIKDEKKSRKIACKPNLRESREKARARARCRTKEKMMNKRLENSSPNVERLGYPNSPFEGGDYSSIANQSCDVGTIENLLGNSISGYQYCSAAVSCCIDPSSNFMEYLGNWDHLLNNDRSLNSTHSAVTNQVSFAGNPNSIYSATPPDFPSLLFHH